MKTNCPNCNKIYEVSDSHIWKKVKCSSCETIFELKESNLNKNTEIESSFNEDKKKQLLDFKSYSLKPKYKSFLFFWYPLVYIFAVLFLVSLFIWFFESLFLIRSLVLGVILIIIYFLISIIYKKEKYTINSDHISFDFWWLFSDNSMDLKYNKITQVTLYQRFLERLLFKTWTIYIWNAWSSQSFIKIKNISNPKKYYEEIQNMMRLNWYSIKKQKLIQTEKPHWLWALWEAMLLSLLLLYVSYYLFPLVLAIIIIRYLDLKNRVYEVFDDCVVYNEWFLDHKFSILPMESISDAENTQSFFSRIFWLHDIVISSEWSKNKVYFKNMINWEKLSKNILYLKKNYHFLPDTDSIDKKESNLEKVNYSLDFDTSFRNEYLPNIFRCILWLSFQAIFSKYKVEGNIVNYKFDFLKTENVTFTTDKISKVVFHESILDKLMWTCSVEFDSIWSSKTIVFKYINKTDTLFDEILWKVWIYKKEENKDIEINFNFSNFFKANIYMFIFIFTLIPFIVYFYSTFYYSKRFYTIKLYNKFIEKKSWIIFQKTEFSTFNNIKNVYAVKSPFTTNWKLNFIVWWDVEMQTGSWKLSTTNSFVNKNCIDLSYIDYCFDKVDIYDEIFLWIKLSSEKIKTYPQDYRNTLLFLLVYITAPFAILSFSLHFSFIFLFIAIIVLHNIFIKSISYILLNDKLLKIYWIIYKTKKSMLFHRINMVEKNQWVINKIFSNWIIKIFSKGSSSSELNIINVKEYNELYIELKKHIN